MKAWIVLAVAMAAGSALADEPKTVRKDRGKVADSGSQILVKTYRTQGWLIHRTKNFRVCAVNLNADFTKLASQCEQQRTRLQATWFGKASESTWSPRCDVIVHASLSDYQQSLGHNVGRSVGCATLKVDGERVVSRRIDIRVDADNWSLDALPHELTHVVLADRFAGQRIPRWADEGMGVMAESAAKQAKRFTALKQSTQAGNSYEINGLMHLSNFPRPNYQAAFYGQSAGLVRFLVRRRSPAHFIQYLDDSLQHGYERALRNNYGIEGISHLTQLRRATTTGPSTSVADTVSKTPEQVSLSAQQLSTGD